MEVPRVSVCEGGCTAQVLVLVWKTDGSQWWERRAAPCLWQKVPEGTPELRTWMSGSMSSRALVSFVKVQSERLLDGMRTNAFRALSFQPALPSHHLATMFLRSTNHPDPMFSAGRQTGLDRRNVRSDMRTSAQLRYPHMRKVMSSWIMRFVRGARGRELLLWQA